MAIVSRISTLRLQDGLGNFRQWQATAATQDTAENGSVSITVALTTGGAAPPGQAATLELRMKNTSGATIRTFTLTPGSASQNVTFHFTANGQSGGGSRHGTVIMDIYAQRTMGGPTSTYEVETDGSPNTPPTGFTATTLDRGWVRGTTTATVSVSNVAFAGAKTEPAVFGESVFHRAVLGSQSFVAQALTHTFTGTSKSTASAATTSVTHDATFSGASVAAGRVNEGFPAADATHTATVSVPNAAVTGQPYTVLTSTTTDTLRVDPRLTCVHLFQLDDNSVGTPPLSKLNSDNDRPASSIGYLATGFHHARGGVSGTTMSGGVNGITADFDLVADLNGDTVSRTATTATNGGEDGWTNGFMTWTSPLPGGAWDKAVDITAPADIDADAYLLNSTATYTLIAAQNPFVAVIVDAGHSSAGNPDNHLVKGDELEVAAFLEFTKAGEEALLEFQSGEIPQCAIKRISSGNVQYWDGTQFTTSAGELVFHPMTQASTYVWTFTVTTDSTWSDVVVQVAGLYNGVAYSGQTFREFAGAPNSHDGYVFDGAGFVGFPTR